MPYTREQLRAYWQTHKDHFNQKRRQKRRLAKLGLVSGEVSHSKPISEMANPQLTRLIKEWQTSTNYSCPPTCAYSYCSNCWYFAANELIDYKTGLYD